MIRNIITICIFFLISTFAFSEVQLGFYRGVNSDSGEVCFIEIRTRSARQTFGVVVGRMLWDETLEIGPLRIEEVGAVKDRDFAGFRGSLESEAELIRLSLDDFFNPHAYIYFNNLDVADKSKPIVEKCTGLRYQSSSNPDET